MRQSIRSREPRTFAEANEMADATDEANPELEEPKTRNLSPEFVDGIWNGVVANFSFGIRSELRVTLRVTGLTVSGRALIARPLYGSGRLSGHIDGETLRFRSAGEGYLIDWEGERSGSALVGSYTVLQTGEVGSWWGIK